MASVVPTAPWRRVLGSGVSLVMATVVASNALRIVSTIALTRLLSPADFGVAGLVATVLTVLMMISDFGFGVYVIQHRDGDDPRLLDAIWTVRLARAAILTLLLMAAAGPAAMAFGKPAMNPVFMLVSLQFVIEGLSSLAPLTAVRQQRLATVSLLDIVTAAAQTVIGIALAFAWRDYWAIVIAGLFGTAIRSALSYAMFPGSRRRFAWDRGEAASLWRFGRTIASAHTIQVLLSNIDKIVLSRIFALDLFGLYVLASNLAGAPAAFTQLYPGRVLLPAYAAALREGVDQLAAIYYRGRRAIMLLYLFAMGGLIGMAPAAVDLLYDPRYAAASGYLRVLLLAPALALNNYAAREVLIVAGNVKTLLFANFVRLGWLLIAGVGWFVLYGPFGLVAAVGLVEVPVMLYCWYEIRRVGVFRLGEEMAMIAVLAAGFGSGLAGDSLYFLVKSGL